MCVSVCVCVCVWLCFLFDFLDFCFLHVFGFVWCLLVRVFSVSEFSKLFGNCPSLREIRLVPNSSESKSSYGLHINTLNQLLPCNWYFLLTIASKYCDSKKHDLGNSVSACL